MIAIDLPNTHRTFEPQYDVFKYIPRDSTDKGYKISPNRPRCETILTTTFKMRPWTKRKDKFIERGTKDNYVPELYYKFELDRT